MNQVFKGVSQNKSHQEGPLTKCGEIHINDESTDAFLFCSFCMDVDQGETFLTTLNEFIDHIKWHRSEDFVCFKEEPASTFEEIEVELARDLCELPIEVEPFIEPSAVKDEIQKEESLHMTGDVLINILDLYKKCPCLWHKETATRNKDIVEATYKMVTSHLNKRTKQTKSVEFVKGFLENIKDNFLVGFAGDEEAMSDLDNPSTSYFPHLTFLLMSDEKKLDESIFTDFDCTICTQELSSQEDLWDHLYQCHLELDEEDSSCFAFDDVSDNPNKSEEDVPQQNTTCEVLEKFVEAYKEQERLWNKNNKEYYKRKLREESYAVLLKILQELDPAATRHDVVDKIKCFRTRFAWERRKIEQNKLLGSEYEPHIWYYKKLLFLVDETKPISPSYRNQDLKTFSCSVCGKIFTNKSSWLDHMQCSHDKEAFQSADGFYYCPVCNIRNKTKYTFIRHLRHSHTASPKTCIDCGTKFQFMSRLVQHRAKVHKDFRPFKCDQCGKGFANLCRMKAHTITHWDVHDRPYACEHCGAKFSNQTNLKVHIRRHTRDFNLRCEVCNHTAATSTELRFHMFTHTKEYPCICDVCGKGFRSTALLATHQKECHGDKLFACKLCSKEFRSLKKLQHHSDSHKPVPDHVCETCGKRFFRTSSLRKHIRMKHTVLDDMQLFDELIDEVDEDLDEDDTELFEEDL